MTINRAVRKPDVETFISKAPDARKGVMRGRKEQISLTIKPDLLTKLDTLAARTGQSRAALISLAIYELTERMGRDA